MTTAGPIPASRAARIVLGLGVFLYIAFYLTWGIRDYNNFGTYGFDFGIHDQAIWLLSRGHSPFVTISGSNYFGDHLHWIVFALVPLYWIFSSGQVLLVVQVLALGLAAVPAFLVARLKLRNEWLACGIAWIYILNPYIGWANSDQFHPDVFEVALVFLAFLFVLCGRWRLFIVMIVLMMFVKEDVPLLALGIGVWVAVLYNRRAGTAAALLSLLWAFINFRFLLPMLSGTGSLAEYVKMHGNRIPFGGVKGFASTFFTKPWKVVSAAFGPGRPTYYLQVFGPLGFLPLLSPSTLVAVILPLAANGLSTFAYQHMLKYHYGTLVVPALLVAAVFGIANLPLRVRKILVGLMLVTSAVGLWLWGPVPHSRDPGIWENAPPAYARAVHDAIEMIPAEAVVSADYHLVTHVDHRVEVYEFPNPWYLLNWAGGVTGRSLPDRVARVQYLLVSRQWDWMF
ncbi:MAG: DUF2079 domain-containing protein [Actinobacteria bacterium]|nr:DUF2079 domain-containing protein [Actinomycetota bacterium]